MLRISQILVGTSLRRLALAAGVVALLIGCGQRGALFLPTGEAAAGRATLTQTLSIPSPAASAPPVTGTASPIPSQ